MIASTLKSLIIFLVLNAAVQAGLEATYRNNLLINPDTNQPFTGNLDIINNDWSNDDVVSTDSTLGLVTGRYVEFNSNYVDGIPHGAEKVFYRSGKLKSVGYFKNGLIDGTTTLYYEDGTVQARVGFNNGTSEGRAVSYYPDGTKQSEQFYVDDKLDGLSREWFESGVLMISRDYSNGLLHGEVKTYYESGK
ncbi:MAG: toxin-antitoxin system YwqK family antitoxin, partial [Gammaproteobacteria bacterium]|nr:toxin-antitoxin system YwqK family antitoxin [Gammaproteobacteria bacterium]